MPVRSAGLAGLAVLAALWLVPWDVAAFPAHMIRHMGLVAVAAPLLALGFPRALAPLAVNPLAAAVVEFVVVWAWHLPAAHAAARLSALGLVAEQGAFLLAGLMVWAGAFGARQPLAGAGGLLLTSMHMTLLGAILVLAPRDLYAELCGTPPDLTGQQLGGLLMLGIGTPVYLAGGLWLVRRALGQGAPA
jgi:putative membrane protein